MRAPLRGALHALGSDRPELTDQHQNDDGRDETNGPSGKGRHEADALSWLGDETRANLAMRTESRQTVIPSASVFTETSQTCALRGLGGAIRLGPRDDHALDLARAA